MNDLGLFELDEPDPAPITSKTPEKVRARDLAPVEQEPVDDYGDELFAVEKPPYGPPSLAEMLKLPRNGLTAVSTFSGCGGSSLGLKWAGWTIPYAVEFIRPARETYLANFPETFVDQRDIRKVTAEDILYAIGMEPGELDLFEGSPPCSSFSKANVHAGSRFGANKVKPYSDGVHQTTDDLFDEWLRLVEGLRPRAILAENVPGMLETKAGLAFYHTILDRLDELGYRCHVAVYSAGHYGAATSRRRLIFTGIRKDVAEKAPVPPKQDEWRYTLGEALATLPVENPADEYEHSLANPDQAIAHQWRALRPGQGGEVIFQVTRCSFDKPVPTITNSGSKSNTADPMHPVECRKFTATEVAWLTGFPADFEFTGDPSQRYERVGRAVPPPLYRAFGVSMARALGATT